MSRGPVAGQASMEYESTFTDMFNLGRVSESNEGGYTCQVSLGSSSLSFTVTVSVVGELISICNYMFIYECYIT